MKAFLAPEIRKSISEKLAFAKPDFLNLVNFGFLDLANFAIVDRFSKLLPILPSLTPIVPLSTSWFFSFLVA